MKKRLTQRQRVLQVLQEANGEPVPGYVLAREGGLQWQTRVYELRHDEGHNIKCHQWRVDGECYSSYTLLPPEKKQQALFPKPEPEEDRRGHFLEVLGRRV